jgi:dihydrofolate reductase
MRKLIAAINMTVDGICDHTAGLPDEELHQHYTELLSQAGAILYGRITYQLMDYWRTFLENPSKEKAMIDFAMAIDAIPKIVFSRTLNNVEWKSAFIAERDLNETVSELKQQSGKDILVGSPSLIIQLLNLNLVDQLQLCVHPVVAGNGLPLFKNISQRTIFNLVKTKTLAGGAVILYYEPRGA